MCFLVSYKSQHASKIINIDIVMLLHECLTRGVNIESEIFKSIYSWLVRLPLSPLSLPDMHFFETVTKPLINTEHSR